MPTVSGRAAEEGEVMTDLKAVSRDASLYVGTVQDVAAARICRPWRTAHGRGAPGGSSPPLGAEGGNMTPQEMRVILVQFATAMHESAAGVPVEAGPAAGPLSRQKGAAIGAALVRYFEELPLADPRLVALAQRFPRVEDFTGWTNTIPDERVPREGRRMIDWLLAHAPDGDATTD
jgi:hypothetical protein